MEETTVIGLGVLGDWLKERGPDPDLWHMIANHLNYDYPESMEIFEWIVDQPECDAATAADILLLLSAEAYMNAETEEDAGYHKNEWRLAKKICDCNQSMGFSSRVLEPLTANDHDWAQSELKWETAIYERMLAEGKVPPWHPPKELLREPITGREVVSDMTVGESSLSRRAN